jgi:hypothetical protein
MGKMKTIRGMVVCLLAAACCGRGGDERAVGEGFLGHEFGDSMLIARGC